MIDNKLNINSFKVIIILITTVTIISISGYFSYTSYQKNITSLQNVEMKRLKSIVSTLSIQISGDDHQKLIETYHKMDDIKSNDQDSIYKQIQIILTPYLSNIQLLAVPNISSITQSSPKPFKLQIFRSQK